MKIVTPSFQNGQRVRVARGQKLLEHQGRVFDSYVREGRIVCIVLLYPSLSKGWPLTISFLEEEFLEEAL